MTFPINKAHLAADYVEWMLLAEGCSEVSRGDLQPESAFEVSPEDDQNSLPADTGDSAVVAKLDARLDDCFNHLEFRKTAMSAAYGFEVSRGVVSKLANWPSRDCEVAYKFLVACGKSELSKSLSGIFTELCKVALGRFLGARASVLNIDAGSNDRKTMGTNSPSVATYLQPLIGVRLNQEMLEQLPDQGDGGCDLVATIDLKDRALGNLTIFGQCAATADDNYWRDKIHQVERFEKIFNWSCKVVSATFIPVVYRQTDGNWVSDINVGSTLLFDRVRILASLRLDQEPLPDYLRTEMEDALTRSLALANNRTAQKAGKGIGKKATTKVAVKPVKNKGSAKKAATKAGSSRRVASKKRSAK